MSRHTRDGPRPDGTGPARHESAATASQAERNTGTNNPGALRKDVVGIDGCRVMVRHPAEAERLAAGLRPDSRLTLYPDHEHRIGLDAVALVVEAEWRGATIRARLRDGRTVEHDGLIVTVVLDPDADTAVGYVDAWTGDPTASVLVFVHQTSFGRERSDG